MPTRHGDAMSPSAWADFQSGEPAPCDNREMAMSVLIAQAAEGPNPILPSSNETLWGAVSVTAALLLAVVMVMLVARCFQRLRRSAEEASRRAAAVEREVVALAAELREKSA